MFSIESASFYDNKLYFEKDNKQTLFLKNMSDNTIVFKVKTSIYKNCRVTPSTGLIKPNSNQLITIIIFNEQEITSNIKFLFKIIPVFDIIPSNIWAITPTKDIYKIKFVGILYSILYNDKSMNDMNNNELNKELIIESSMDNISTN